MDLHELKLWKQTEMMEDVIDGKMKPFDTIYKEALEYPSILLELSTYQLEKLNDINDAFIQNSFSNISKIILNNPEYNYPEGISESEIYDYWINRSQRHKRLERLKNSINEELISRKNHHKSNSQTAEKIKRESSPGLPENGIKDLPGREEIFKKAKVMKKNGYSVQGTRDEIARWLLTEYGLSEEDVKERYNFGLTDCHSFNRLVNKSV